MTEVEIEEFVDILLRITHNEYAREFEIPMGGNLSNGFVLEFYDGRTISVGGMEIGHDGLLHCPVSGRSVKKCSGLI